MQSNDLNTKGEFRGYRLSFPFDSNAAQHFLFFRMFCNSAFGCVLSWIVAYPFENGFSFVFFLSFFLSKMAHSKRFALLIIIYSRHWDNSVFYYCESILQWDEKKEKLSIITLETVLLFSFFIFSLYFYFSTRRPMRRMHILYEFATIDPMHSTC